MQNVESTVVLLVLTLLRLVCYFSCNSFPIEDEMKSVVEYFKEMYGFTIKQPHLPCLLVGNPKKPNYLPMEVSN